ncbi:hypothetical protein BDW42DRAFT_174314 [Aspergillus taichungensis]|uniref:Uncharacterized protein n=1 Tax=Aspergillus taichungensis TaxID=482145 RepID=A0A2J5HNH2_9EURO|nr:hypothetical protein BDW42DRAFT_174314 [Aspergillus taichungensis]
MPVKWTPENDQLLLLKILETHELSVDTKKVADAWPAGESHPTPRAITERLVRMRQMVKQTNKEGSEGHFSIGKGGSSTSTPSTPRKPRKGPGSATATPSSGKRKRVVNGAAALSSPVKKELDEGLNVGSVPVKVEQDTSLSRPSFDAVPYANGRDETAIVGSTIGLETQVGSGVYPGGGGYDIIMRGGDVSPTKRPRRAAVPAPGMMRYMVDGDDDEVDVESSASEYVPEQRGLFGVQPVDRDIGFA